MRPVQFMIATKNGIYTLSFAVTYDVFVVRRIPDRRIVPLQPGTITITIPGRWNFIVHILPQLMSSEQLWRRNKHSHLVVTCFYHQLSRMTCSYVRQDVLTSEEYNLHSANTLSSIYSVLIRKYITMPLVDHTNSTPTMAN